MTVHRKPTIEEALVSAINQTRRDAQILVIDSGQWMFWRDEIDKAMAQAYSRYKDHPMVEWVFTGESAGANLSSCMVAKAFNRAFEAGLVRGQYLCTFYDDDRYEPTFFERMAGFLDEHPDTDAVWCSEQWVNLHPSGTEEKLRVLKADRVLTGTDQFDQVVDGMQVMMRTDCVRKLSQPIIPEEVTTCRHSDGLFFERLKTVINRMDPIEDVLCTHRFTQHSTFTRKL